MLLYHFGTRDALLRAVLVAARQRQVEAFTELLRVRPGEPYDTAGQPLWPDFRRTATTDWLAPLEEGMRSMGRPELATLALAVIRGLLMDLDATGDAARTNQAFAGFLDTLAIPPCGHLGADYRCPDAATAVENGV